MIKRHPFLFSVAAVVLLAAFVTFTSAAGYNWDWLGLDLPWLK